MWEAAKGRGRAVTTAPHWIWEGLASYDPDAAELAVEAADMASSARYFSVLAPPSALAHAHTITETHWPPATLFPRPSKTHVGNCCSDHFIWDALVMWAETQTHQQLKSSLRARVHVWGLLDLHLLPSSP